MSMVWLGKNEDDFLIEDKTLCMLVQEIISRMNSNAKNKRKRLQKAPLGAPKFQHYLMHSEVMIMFAAGTSALPLGNAQRSCQVITTLIVE